MSVKKSNILVFFLLLAGTNAWSQKDVLSMFKGQLKLAQKFYSEYSFKDALVCYQRYYSNHREDSIALKIALCYDKLNMPDSSTVWFEKISNTYLYQGKLELIYKKNKLQTLDLSGKNLLDNDNTKLPPDFYADSSNYLIKNLEINSADDEFAPEESGDALYFVSSRSPSFPIKEIYNWNNGFFLNFFKSNFHEDGSLAKASLFPDDLPNGINKGPFVIYDSAKKILFTANSETKTSSDISNLLSIYAADVSLSKIEHSRKLNLAPDGFSSGHPTVDSKGTYLYFISNMPGGFGGTDIYSCKLLDNNCIDIKNLGSSINTKENEMFPHIFQDTILFFSSSGHQSAGGLDIFYTFLSNTKAKPINLGYPINSNRDDFGFKFSTNGNYGFFASSRSGGNGGDDLYFFRLNARKLNIIIKDEQGHDIGEGAQLIINVDDKESLIVQTTTGINKSIWVFPDKKYLIKIVKKGYIGKDVDFYFNANDPNVGRELIIILNRK